MLSLSDQVLMTEGVQFSWGILPPNLNNAFELHVKTNLKKKAQTRTEEEIAFWEKCN